MSGFTKEQVNLMRQACLLCDNSSLDVRTGCLIVLDGVVIGEGWNCVCDEGSCFYVEGGCICEGGDCTSDLSDLFLEDSSGSTGSINSVDFGKVLHAEVVALKKADSLGIPIGGFTAYVTRFPCEECAVNLVEAGISGLFYMSDHFSSGNAARPIFEKIGLEVVQIPEETVWHLLLK